MSARHYDVVVLGRSIGTLLTAALLARRELRVLVLGQGQRAPQYRVEEHTLARRSFTLLAATSPTFRRILQELAQTQRFRRLTAPLDPMFALLDGRTRFEVPPDVELFTREIEREYPQVERAIAELYGVVSEVNGRIDAAFERDAIWPPGTLWEKLETGRISSGLPLVEAGDEVPSIFARFPSGHGFRRAVELPALFSSHLGLDESALSPFSTVRLHGSWARGVQCLPQDEQEFEDFLIERIESHGGVCRLRDHASQLLVKRGRVVGIQEDGESWATGADAVVTNVSGETIADLALGAGITRKALTAWPEVKVVGGRFIVSLVVLRSGLPAPLPRESFLVSPDPSLPTVHLKRGPSHDGDAAGEPTDTLVAEMLLPRAGSVHFLGAREAVLSTLRHYLPFLDDNALVIDSPHDGLPAVIHERGANGQRQKREIDRIHLKDTSTQPEAMEPRLVVNPRGYLGIAGEPIRGPILETYLVGPSVLPALGQEGEVMAAWGAARILTKKDRTRQKLRRQMWTKIETT